MTTSSDGTTVTPSAASSALMRAEIPAAFVP
jgi:hypothetical protein